MIVVSDTSPITNLIKLNRLGLLHDLYDVVVIPPAVRREIDFVDENREAIARIDWIKTIALKQSSLFDTLPKQLDVGEAEAIALSIELGADLLLIDETDGRRVATERGLIVTGLVGVLLDAKAAGLIPLVKPELERLEKEARFWMSNSLKDLTLELAGEK